ncbi:MAG TPA: DUF4340 domain-containing protein, partial [Tepidisphaeraceae bacterium]|nr:DUF4340 domain-containing protein [Tepidisphaeraceae bacterium]
ADVVGGDLVEKLDMPATDYRDKRLAIAASTDVRQLRIMSPVGTVALEKHGSDWQITQPQPMPADTSAVSDVLLAITGLRALAFESDAEQVTTALGPPRVTVQYSTEAPATQPAATQPAAMKSVTLGRYADVLKKDVLATSTDLPGVVRVSASTIESLSKRPLELRDKKVLDVDPERVATLTVRTQASAATQPAVTPREVTITRRPPAVPAVMGPAEPTTGPSTQAAATQPAASKWVVTSPVDAQADDAAIDALFADLHPLRAEKFLASPSTQPVVGTYVLSGATSPKGPMPRERFDLTIRDLGDGQPPVGQYGDLAFELPQSVLDHVKARLAAE